MRVRANLKTINNVVATIKAAAIKNQDRKKDYHEAGLPVITILAAWFIAALHYSEYFPAVRTFVNNWTGG